MLVSKYIQLLIPLTQLLHQQTAAFWTIDVAAKCSRFEKGSGSVDAAFNYNKLGIYRTTPFLMPEPAKKHPLHSFRFLCLTGI